MTPTTACSFISSADETKAKTMSAKIQSGWVAINQFTFDLVAPFDGYKHSGIRIFDEPKRFHPNIQTHVTMFSSKECPSLTKIQAVETLVKLYGEDDGGNTEVEFHEREIIDAMEFWTGRTWNFNESH